MTKDEQDRIDRLERELLLELSKALRGWWQLSPSKHIARLEAAKRYVVGRQS